MKKILSILICVLISAAAAADWTGTAQLTVYGQTGKGKVYIEESSNGASVSTPADDVAWTYDSKTEGDKDNVNSNSKSAYFAIHAKADTRYYFEGWYSNETRTNSRSITAKDYNATVTASSSSGKHDHYYAKFARIISISSIKTEKILAWLEGASLNTSRAKIIVPVQAAQDGDIMTIDIIGSGDEYLPSTDVKLYNADNTIDITSTKQITRSADGNFVFYVGYQGAITDLSVLIQKKIRLKVVAKGNPDDRDWEEFDVTIAEAPKLKFKGTNGKGTYSSNLLPSFDTNSSDTYEVAIKNASMLSGVNLSLLTDPTDGEIFFGWKVTKLDGTETLISDDESCTAPEFEGGETIEAVFVPNTCGYIIMNGNAGNMSVSNNNVYVDLHSALVDAETIKNKTNKAQFVVLENLSTIFTNKGVTRTKGETPNAATSATLPNREGGYTIPADITLLIPADKVYNYCLGEMSKDYYSGGSLTQYRKLVVEKGTQITVNGNICVFGLLNCNSAAVGSCGVIELQEGSHIDVNGGLYVFGYIINPQGTKVTDENMHLVGKITVNTGAEVREVLQMTDWRGGQATSGMISAKNVFPINQYYAQNIEAPITLKEGSREILTTAVEVTLLGKMVAHPKFILPLDDGEEGFFLMGPATSLTKYYDWENDRLKCIVKGEPTTDVPNPIANISSMNISLGSYNVVSANFVLPVTNNIDIRVTNITVNLPNPMCVLAGGTLTVDDNAKVFVNGTSNKVASCYVYDKEWNTQDGKGTGAGYFGQSNVSVALLSRRPGNFNTPRRTIKDDASLIINGLVEIGQYGALYTTAEGSEGYTYGANITSTGSGRIKFVNIRTGTKTQQVTQNNTTTTTFDIPVSSARLKNSDGTFVHTNYNESRGKSYVYIDGFWQIPTWVLPIINITLPTQVFKGTIDYPITDYDKNDNWEATLSGDGFTFDGTNKTITLKHNDEMGNNITLPIHYTAQNKHGNHEAMITLTNATKNETYSTPITATEEYTPIFNVTPTDIPLGETYINTPISVGVPTLQITPQSEENVTSLHDDDTYYSRLKWEAVSIKNSDNTDNTDFTFTQGEGKNALSGAKITFNSATPGTQSVKITLRAAYTDASSPSQQINSEDVIINVTATAKALEANNFTLTDECEQELKKMCVGIPVALEFKDLTLNTKPLNFQFANNGAVGSEVLTLSGEGTDEEPYTIIANSVPTDMPTITISQESDGIYVARTTTYATQIRNCTPEVQWNWSDMYFGKTYNNPITTNSTGAYTLTLKSVTKNGTAVTVSNVITYNNENKTATVKSNLSGEYIATFEFVQEAGDAHIAYSQTFTANIYQDPSVLPLCVESERIFTAVTSTSTGEVKYNINQIDFSENATWTMTFIGIPDVLSFTPTANTQLTIEQREEGGSFGTVFYQMVEAGTNYQVELAPATKYVKFTVVNAASLSSLCLTELNRVRLEPQILYMPIAKDPENAPTTRTITATYVNKSRYALNVISSVGEITAYPNKLEPTAEGQYKVVNITISSKATSEFDAFVSVEYSNNEHAQVDIETYRFPQKLPIQLERGKDEAKRFYFVTSAYKNTEWDAAQYAIKMQNKTTAEADRPFVTFAFEGAPSFISFVPVVATTTADWLIEEGVDATSLDTVKVEATMENGELKQTLDYTTRYVRVTYVGTSAEVVQMTKVNILSDQSAIPNPEELELTDANKYVDDLTVGKDLNLTVVNLTNLSVAIDNDRFTLSYGAETPTTTFELDVNDIDNVFGEDVVGAIPFKVFWDASQATDFGNITFTTEVDGVTKILATVPLVGTKAGISEKDVIYTGVKTDYTLDGKFEGIYGLKDEVEKSTEHRKVDLSSTYDQSGKPLFDYLIIYGETTTTDGTTTITTPTTTAGSNAKTPMYIYYKDGNSYKFWTMEENVNTANKAISSLPIANGQQLRVYITGFCPYATTGYTKEDEGVWYFQGVNGAKLDIYLEDCYIYSRHKTLEGRAFSGRYDGQAFSEGYVRGSGGVLVFENQDNDPSNDSFDVTIHTRRNNMFKSNYGCFFELMQGMRAYNVSSPIQVHLASEKHKANSKTTLTFDDKWPNDATNYDSFDRTNGYLSLQKQVNNAPSIDLGNANTIVNFKGGQVELQNAAVVSPNYKTTFAISFRSGLMAGFPMAYGIGTDDVGGTVNFYDGTTTVIPMVVDVKYRDYYLMDTDANGKELSTTSCLRTPTNTFVYGGSHCMMRACEDVTSKGGAPTRNGNPLGIYKYPKTKPTSGRGGFGEMNAVGLVTPTDIPTSYKAESVTPNTNGTLDTNDDYLNFWFSTEDEPSVTPEVDKKINFWKACMTQISAQYMSYGGNVGGETKILPNEENKYLLYCQIDENISKVISAGTGFGEDRKYTYMAPVKDPTSGQLTTPYLSIPPSYVGEELQNYIETVTKEDSTLKTGENYTISEKVYYVVPTTADIWMTFTAPFNVEKLYIVEAYEEAKLAATPLKKVTDEDGDTITLNKRQSVLLEQAKHNADFAAFFGVAMALGRDQTFEQIHQDYEGWAKYVDKKENTRGKIKLEHYNGNNFFTANYYLYHNAGEWTRNGDKFDTKWEVVGEVAEGEILMRQGETYSMLFPYCTGCDVLKDAEGNIIVDANGLPQLSAVRDYWDYWSGKFLIFESTQASSKNPHTIKGSKHRSELFAPASSGNGTSAVLTGNSTFALMTSDETVDSKVYTYSALMGRENFENNSYDDGYGTMLYQQIQPTVSFLIADIPSQAGMPARNVMRTGEIIYGKENTPTDVNPGGNIPTVGGGNDLFITSTVEGINIAVAEPQHVRVMSATGAIIYSGLVQTAVDVALPATGVYVITGENEVHKILH